MSRPINPASRYSADRPCPHDGTYLRYRIKNECCECKKRWQEAAGPIHRTSPQHRMTAAKPAKPMPHPHVIQSDWIKSPTKAQLMAGK